MSHDEQMRIKCRGAILEAIDCLDEIECRDESVDVLSLILEAVERAVALVSVGPMPDPISEVKQSEDL